MFLTRARCCAAQGTVIGDALKLCNTALDTKEKKYKAVILISDGEDHDQKADAALKELAIKVWLFIQLE